MSLRLRARTITLVSSLIATAVHAAGGHFDVDDATVLDPGQCQLEAWIGRVGGSDARLFHLGPGCRAGPVELGVNIDRLESNAERRTLVGPQVKLVVDLLPDVVSAGIAWNASFDVSRGGRTGQSLYLPVTWRVAERFWLNANAGADRGPEARSTRRLGLSVEWVPNQRWSLIAERLTASGEWTSRLGLRVNVGASTSVDFSAARIGQDRGSRQVLGLNHAFAR